MNSEEWSIQRYYSKGWIVAIFIGIVASCSGLHSSIEITPPKNTMFRRRLLSLPLLRYKERGLGDTRFHFLRAADGGESYRVTSPLSIESPREWIEDEVRGAMKRTFADVGTNASPMVVDATKFEFGDYQCNVALPLAKPLGAKPRDIAQKIIDNLDVSEILDAPEIAGPGFINFRLSSSYVTSKIAAMVNDAERLGISQSKRSQRIVVDFSSPNIAKEMHVGHLRSTIIGDTLCNVLEFLGHDVLRLNHVGDWGTQFGMLVTYLKEEKPDALNGHADIGDLVEFYKKAKLRFDCDSSFQDRSRSAVVKLQSGDVKSIEAWKFLCDLSRKEFQIIYDMLNVRINERGESFYNEYLPRVITGLKEVKLLAESDGAQVVYIDGVKNREDNDQALIVQKSDGGYMYSTTDLAAIRHRTEVERAERILYVTDIGQSSHFEQVFYVARKAKFVSDAVKLEHVPFGLVQGEDGKKFKTRSGDTVKLKDLLQEAVRITTEDLRERLKLECREPTDEELAVARKVGLGAVKYADLCMNRESNYRFSYSKMLSLQGNTAPYMMYAYARIQGIRRKAAYYEDHTDVKPQDIVLEDSSEMALARVLVKFQEVLANVEKDLYPNKLCDYLFDVSQKFNKFYEDCPVNAADSERTKKSRVALCSVTAGTIKLGLKLLGIDTVEKL